MPYGEPVTSWSVPAATLPPAARSKTLIEAPYSLAVRTWLASGATATSIARWSVGWDPSSVSAPDPPRANASTLDAPVTMAATYTLDPSGVIARRDGPALVPELPVSVSAPVDVERVYRYTVSSALLVTYTLAPSGDTTTPNGFDPVE